jgi:hypothetical protein
MQATKIIGLYSDAPGCGKSTVAKELNNLGYVTVSFATPLKRMVISFLIDHGIEPSLAWKYVNTDKESLIPGVGVSSRHLQRTLGTEWGRSCVHPKVWLNAWMQRSKAHPLVVVDDVRFPNEAALILGLGGELWKVTRPGFADTSGHASEAGLGEYSERYTEEIDNSGSIAQLELAVRTAAAEAMLVAK